MRPAGADPGRHAAHPRRRSRTTAALLAAVAAVVVLPATAQATAQTTAQTTAQAAAGRTGGLVEAQAPEGQAPEDAGLAPQHQAWAQVGLVPVVGAEASEIYVAAVGGDTQAVSFVQLPLAVSDLAAAPTLTLRLVPGDDRVADASARLVACPLKTPLAADGALPADAAPEYDCLLPTEAVREPDGAVVFDLAALLPSLEANGVPGVALLPAPPADGSPSTFRLPFRIDQTRLLTGQSSTLPEEIALPPSDPAFEPAPPPADAGSAAAPSFDTGTSSGGFAPGLDLAPPPVASLDLPLTATTATPTPAPAVAVAPPPSGASVPTTPVAFAPLAAADPVRTVFGLLALALAAALLVVGLGRQAAVPGLAGVVVAPPVVARRAPVLAYWLAERRASTARSGELDPLAAAGLLATLTAVPVLVPEVAGSAARLLAVAVAVLGLHVLVTWAGQLSLAQAALVALPAVAVARLSERTGISPVHLLPLAVVVGATAAAGLGALLSTLPARGASRSVPLLTGVFAVAVGALLELGGGDLAAAPSRLGPISLTTESSRAVLLAGLAVLALLAVRSLRASGAARAAWLLASDPRAAAAAGVDRRHALVTTHAVAGALAGLAGAMAVVAGPVPSAPGAPVVGPLLLGLGLLAAVSLAGPGGAGGVLVAGAVLFPALFLDAPALLTLAAAVGGLLLTRLLPFAGLNAYGRTLMRSTFSTRNAPPLAPSSYEAPSSLPGRVPGEPSATVDLPMVAGIVLVFLGLGAIGFGWYHAGDTPQLWVQMQYLISGGIGGLALVVLGTGLMLWSRFAAGSAAMAREALEIARRGLEADTVVPSSPRELEMELDEIVPRPTAESNGSRPVRTRSRR